MQEMIFPNVDKDFNDYLRLFAGFLVQIDKNAIAAGDDPTKGISKLAPVQRYQWGHSMLGTLRYVNRRFREMSDSWFEALNLIDCMAMWLSKHAAWVAGKDDVKEYEAKECLTCLRRAAGMFSYVGAHIGKFAFTISFLSFLLADLNISIIILESSGRLSGTGDFEGADFDPKVGRAYEQQ
ncbi:hypothetical protein OSTOST_18572, partial [Ostertagia ostertagi]